MSLRGSNEGNDYMQPIDLGGSCSKLELSLPVYSRYSLRSTLYLRSTVREKRIVFRIGSIAYIRDFRFNFQCRFKEEKRTSRSLNEASIWAKVSGGLGSSRPPTAASEKKRNF